MAQTAEYHPQFWIFGSIRPDFMPTARQLGFIGVGYWAADREDARIKYYFNSPTLERVGWATRVKEKLDDRTYEYAGRAKQGKNLADYAAKAHSCGLKVMANMEGVNPYHWEAGREKWTPEIISSVAKDLRADGADRWFTECMAGWPHLMSALSDTCRDIGMEYQEGSDPSYLHNWGSEVSGRFPELYRRSGYVSMYHYHYKRDTMGKLASLAQEGTLSYGFAREWNCPTALVYPVGCEWGELPENWEGILKASILIRALQFRTRDIMIIRESEEQAHRLNIADTTRWVQGLVAKNAAENRPEFNVVAHLRTGPGSHWRDFATSGDAISSGAFHAGYDLLCTTRPLPDAAAYYVYTAGRDDQGTFDLTPEIVALFESGKPVFLQVGGTIPSGDTLTPNWRKALVACGIDPDAALAAGELPAAGAYAGQPLKYTGVYTAYTLTERRQGTRIPASAVTGKVLAEGDGTPLIVGRGSRYLIPASCISWQLMYPISRLLSGAGAAASSDVWGIAGEKVTALMAIHDTDLDLTIPKLASGAKIHVGQWNKRHEKTYDETITYTGSYRRALKQYDLVVIEPQ